jgi:hypothetical protein
VNRDTRIGIWGTVAFAILFTLIAVWTVYGQAGPAPVVTEVESLRLENVQLKAAQIQQQILALQDQFSKLQREYRAMTDQLAKEHPGFMWNGQKLVPAKEAPTTKQ